MMTGNPIVDAVGGGVLSAIGGWITTRILKRKMKREFRRTGGFTYDEAMKSANELGQLEGWKINGPIVDSVEVFGRKVCFECLKDFPLSMTEEYCPICDDELFVMRDEQTVYTVDLVRDVAG